MQKNLFNNSLLKPNIALSSYLDQLLHEATVDLDPLETEDKLASLVQEEGLIYAELLVAEKTIYEPQIVVDNDVQARQILASEPEPEFESDSLEPDLFPLQCLMFRVAGILLSVPLIRMKSVVPWIDNLTILPQSPAWMLGVFKYQDHNVRVVDSTQVFHIKPGPVCVPGHVLVLGNEELAITCDKLENVVTLEYSDIQWNQRQNNSMIFGTIRQSLANLLNPEGIINSLKTLNLN